MTDGGCSEDYGDDFAAWIVMQGQAPFDDLRSDPSRIQNLLDTFGGVESHEQPELAWDNRIDRDEYRGYQRADYIVTPIYELRFGEDLHDACYDGRGWPRE